MRMRVCIGLYLLSVGYALQAAEYVYPVDITDQKNARTILLMHQTPEKKMQVLMWDRVTHQIQQVLAAYHQPSGVRRIPDGSGFSFIEEDILCIQDFSKRSPELIMFDEPIYGLTLIWWLDAQRYYFAAQDEDRYGIYQGNRKGLVNPIIVDDRYDYLYPQKVDDVLFCVRRLQGHHEIISLPYPLIHEVEDEADDQKVMSRLQRIADVDCGAHCMHIPVQVVCASETQPITFLTMISQHRGFYMSHPAHIDVKSPYVPCSYHEIIYDQQKRLWTDTCIITFSVPLYMIQFASEKGLYETIYPLLPQYIPEKNGVLYIDAADKGNELWRIGLYDCASTTTKILYTSSAPLMRPSWWQGKFQIGRTVTQQQPFFDEPTKGQHGDQVSLIEI